MILGGGPLGRYWGHKGRALRNGICAFIKEAGREGACEVGEMAPLWTRGGSLPDANLLAPSSWSSKPPELWVITFSCLEDTMSMIFGNSTPDRLRQLERMNSTSTKRRRKNKESSKHMPILWWNSLRHRGPSLPFLWLPKPWNQLASWPKLGSVTCNEECPANMRHSLSGEAKIKSSWV